MRSEETIRKHLAHLRWAQRQPCGCVGTAHEFACVCGGRMMTAVIKTLEWALGDNDDIGNQVERLAADHARAAE